MPLSSTQKNIQSDRPIWYFLLCWTIFNALQAYTLELHADEAYYWLYSKYLNWGYFDHPPMVALFIRIGDTLMHNELGLRLITVLTSTVSLYVLWLILKRYAVDALSFILATSGILIFSIYGFTTTPDVPLFFFTVLFYYVYQRYIDEDKWTLAVLLGIIIACAFYSKYHAVLLVVFTLLSNIKLLKRWSFWGIVVIAVILYLPHIIWQVQHGYPSVNYHLYERAVSIYHSSNSYSYIPGQLLMAGPIIGWFLFYTAFTIKVKDAFIRCLLVNCIGTLTFFFITTFRGEAQPHWTLIAFAPLVMLALIRFKQLGKIPTWFYVGAVINTSLIFIFRLMVMFEAPLVSQIGQIKSYYHIKEWAKSVKQQAGDSYVIMYNGFQNPAKYNYYNNTLKAFSYDSRYYHRTQFDLWPIEEKMQGKRVLYLDDYPAKDGSSTIFKDEQGIWYPRWIDDFRSYQKVKIETDFHKLTMAPGQKKDIDLTITNPYPYTINFSNEGQKQQADLLACFFTADSMAYARRDERAFNKIILKPGESTHYIFSLELPKHKGKYDLIFSIRATPFPGSTNSRSIKLTVE